MNNGLILFSIGLTALIGSICTLLYSRIHSLTEMTKKQNSQIAYLNAMVESVLKIQTSTQHCVNEMATEMQLRDVYQSADDRHKLAIKAAKNGQSSMELVRQHGLSTDEAALIISLHGVTSDYTNDIPSNQCASTKDAALTES